MPDKTFAFTSAILFSQSISGNINLNLGQDYGGTTFPFSTYIGGIGLGTANISISLTSTNTVNSAAVQGSGGFTQELDMDYTDAFFGLPEGAKIKKMEWFAPYSLTASSSTTLALPTPDPGPYGLHLAGSMFRSVGSFTKSQNLASTNITVGSSASISSSSSGGLGNAWIVFDLTSGSSFIERDVFIVTYKRILVQMTCTINCINNNFSAVSTSVDYNYELETMWNLRITYDDAPISWTLVSPPANRAIQPGDTIVFSGTDLDLITSVDVEEIPVTNYTINDEGTEITIILPDDIGDDSTATINATTFDGTVPLQTFPTIYFENAPGIYTFIDNRTHDTYYDWDASPVGTIDTKIPNPTGRTGFY